MLVEEDLLLTTYEVVYIYGVLSPKEAKIEIEISTNDTLTEELILKEIYLKHPQREGTIQGILSTFVKNKRIIKVQKQVDNKKDNLEEERNPRKINSEQSFVW